MPMIDTWRGAASGWAAPARAFGPCFDAPACARLSGTARLPDIEGAQP